MRGGVVDAQAVFNSPGEMPTITITNHTTSPCSFGPNFSCWKTSETARPGDVIAVHLYYRNTSNVTANETTLSVRPQSSGPTTSVTFTGGVASLSGPRSTGSAHLSIQGGAQSLSFMEARWYPQNVNTAQSVNTGGLFGTSGFNIGNVTPGTQGVLVVNYRVSNNVDVPPPPPVDQCRINSFTAFPTLVQNGGYTTLSWNTFGCTSATIDGVPYPVNGSGSFGPLYSARTYQLRATGPTGLTQYQSVYVGVQNVVVTPPPVQPVQTQPQAVTTVATLVGQNSAQLNGLAILNSTGSGQAWFEWGTTPSLGNRTTNQLVNQSGSVQVSDGILGLLPNTRYYYRIGVSNQFGTVYGSPVSFVTASRTTTVVTTPSPQPVRTVAVARSAPSLLELRIESIYANMCVNGDLEYKVYYRNISSQTLENTVLRVTLPKELTYIQSNRGKFEIIDRTLTIDLGQVRAGEQGEVTLRTRVNRQAVTGNLTVATATVVYTNTITRAQEDAIAYSLITVSDDCPNLLGASAFGIWSFLPNTLIEWLLLILIILVLVVLVRQMTKKKE